MTPQDWEQVFELLRAAIVSGVSIGFVAALLATANT